MSLNEFQNYFDAKELGPMCYWLLDFGFSEEVVRDIENKLREPHRFYHGPFHIKYLWDLLEKRKNDYSEKEFIVLALSIVFHDIIYNIGSNINEEDSTKYFLAAKQKSHNVEIDIEITNLICDCIHFSKPSHYWQLKESENPIPYRFVVDYDLNHFCDPDFDSDLASWLLFKEFQYYPYEEYVKGTEGVLGQIPFSHVREGVERALKWLKDPSRRFSFGVYAGSFNPFHVGHASILRQAEHLFDKVIVLVGSNPAKKDGTPQERAKVVQELLPYHQVSHWTGLTTDYLTRLERETGASVTLIRGLRTDTDFATEEQNQRWMEDLKPDLKIMYVPCEAQYRHVSSSGLRFLQQYETDRRATALHEEKYKVNTDTHYHLTKKIIARKVSTRI